MGSTKHKPLRTTNVSLQEIAAYIWNIFFFFFLKINTIEYYFVNQILKKIKSKTQCR